MLTTLKNALDTLSGPVARWQRKHHSLQLTGQSTSFLIAFLAHTCWPGSKLAKGNTFIVSTGPCQSHSTLCCHQRSLQAQSACSQTATSIAQTREYRLQILLMLSPAPLHMSLLTEYHSRTRTQLSSDVVVDKAAPDSGLLPTVCCYSVLLIMSMCARRRSRPCMFATTTHQRPALLLISLRHHSNPYWLPSTLQ